jgi:hypothetical protein
MSLDHNLLPYKDPALRVEDDLFFSIAMSGSPGFRTLTLGSLLISSDREMLLSLLMEAQKRVSGGSTPFCRVRARFNELSSRRACWFGIGIWQWDALSSGSQCNR